MGRSKLVNTTAAATRSTPYFFFIAMLNSIAIRLQVEAATANATATHELTKGFKATPDPSISSFQPLLSDSTQNFSLGFLRVNTNQLALAVIHVPSSEPLWLAGVSPSPSWSGSTELLFDGSLVISDPHNKVYWSTNTKGDKVVLTNASNVEIQQLDSNNNLQTIILWQSFDFPTDTLMENQNFTSNMSLISSNGPYEMRLGSNFIGLYSKFGSNTDQIYHQHKALEVKANIVEGKGPLSALVHSDGYLAMYQPAVNSSIPVDIDPFNSFQRSENGLLMVRLESDGNLKGYYWDGEKWILDYAAISNDCDLPSPCGPYGLCNPGANCSCLNNHIEYTSAGGCSEPTSSGSLCSQSGTLQAYDNAFSVIRRSGIELANKELLGYKSMSSLQDCEAYCRNNCSCWGAVYNNASGFCYIVDYPIQSLVRVDDDSKVGYFKVWKEEDNNKAKVWYKVGIVLIVLGIVGAITAVVVIRGIKNWRKKRGVNMFVEEHGGASPAPYKNLASHSFRGIELSKR